MSEENKIRVEKLKQIKDIQDKLSEEKRNLENSLPELVIYQNSDGTYTRFTKTDNLKEIEEKGTVFRSYPISKYTTKIENLKNLPKELKNLND